MTTLAQVVTLRRGSRARLRVTALALVSLVIGLFLARVLLGDYTVTVPDAVRIVTGTHIPVASFILMESKLPRAVMAVLAGAAFGASGAAFQSMLRNPLASPDILGISLGASAAAVFAGVVLGLSGTPVTVAAFVGAVVVALVVHGFAGHGGGATGRMVLVGVGLAAMLGAVVQWVLLTADVYRAQDALVWLTGSLNAVSWTDIGRLLLLDALVLPVLLVLAGRLALLALGDDLASGLGIRAGRLRLGVTACVVLLTASATSVVGPVAFVALLSGPIARRLGRGRTGVGSAALVGAALVLAADYLAAYAVPGTPMPVGVVTGLAGAPFLLWLLVAQRQSP